MKLTILIFSFLISSFVLANPIDQECESTNNNHDTDCPNDPFHNLAYEMDYMNFGYAWDKSYGTARVHILEIEDSDISFSYIGTSDIGRISPHNSGMFYPYEQPVNFPPAAFRVSQNCKRLYSQQTCQYYNPGLRLLEGSSSSRHADMVVSLYGSIADNGIGMSSFCRECTLSVSTIKSSGVTPILALDYLALSRAIDQGSQIINISGFWLGNHISKCADSNPQGYRAGVCALLEKAKERDVIIVASNGNTKNFYPNWPANETDLVIGVGGTDITGGIWDKSKNGGSCPCAKYTLQEIIDRNLLGLCPYGPTSTNECGAQYFVGSSNNIMAPAQNIRVYHDNGSYNVSIGCVDFNQGTIDEGFIQCSGTSFSAPIIGGVVAIMKSLNPLLSFNDIKATLLNSRVTTIGNTSYSIPDINKIIKNKILGYSNGIEVLNRVKPMFRLKHEQHFTSYPSRTIYLSTSIPQVALAALSKTYMTPTVKKTGRTDLNSGVIYTTNTTDPLAAGYNNLPSTDSDLARAPFYIFGGHKNPFNGNDDMIPLIHYAYKKLNFSIPGCEANADHGYATNLPNEFTVNHHVKCAGSNYLPDFLPEGIEGYLLPSCPPEVGGCFESTNNPSDLQCLRLRYSETEKSHALFMESEQDGVFASYTTKLDTTGKNYLGLDNSECLGYVFPNVDSDNDLIIDGMELILGTNPNNSDSDGDTASDGCEYPPASNYFSDPLLKPVNTRVQYCDDQILIQN